MRLLKDRQHLCLYTLALGAADVGICNKDRLSFCCALLPSRWSFHLCQGELQGWNGRKVIWRHCAACVCLPVRGREWQPGVTHSITLADWGLFLASTGTLIKAKHYAAFSPVITSSTRCISWPSFIWHQITLFYLEENMLSHNQSF